jgi:hypothetical protein
MSREDHSAVQTSRASPRRARIAAPALVAVSLSACGGEPTEGTAIALRVHEMGCTIPALQASLQVEGLAERCPLEVRAETQTVEGRCNAVPTGSVVDLRLVYYVLIPRENDPVELATIALQADLRSISSKAVVVDFNRGELVRDYDDDQDGKSNLTEVCAGGNPRFRE